MRCKVCGEEIGDKKVCPICGTAVKINNIEEDDHETLNLEENKVKEKNPTNQSKLSILQEIEDEKIKMIEKASKGIVKITCFFEDYASCGTGFVVSNRIIVTNSHVIGNRKQNSDFPIVAEFSDKLKLGARQTINLNLVYFDENEDVAFLVPENNGLIPSAVSILNLSNEETKQGESVFTIGNPLHYKFTYTEGVVANPNYDQNPDCKFKILQTTLTLNHGNSGGPVLNLKGEVVGMATYSELLNDENDNVKEIVGYGFCVKSETIIHYLNLIHNNRR